MVKKFGSHIGMASALGLIVALMLVFAAAPAFGSEVLNWNSCKKTPGTGSYEDAACSKALSGGNYSWAALSAETPFKSQGALHRIKTVQSGVVMEITCISASGEGQLANGETGALVSGYHPIYNNCSVTAPAGKGCKIKENAIAFRATGGYLKSATSQEMWFYPSAGEALAEWNMEGCSISPLNRNYWLKGKYGGLVDNGASSLSVTRESSQSTLNVMGQTAWIEGTSKIETGSGEALKLGL